MVEAITTKLVRMLVRQCNLKPQYKHEGHVYHVDLMTTDYYWCDGNA